MEILQGIGWLFANPVFYLAILFAIVLGYVRVKNERKHFRIRLIDGWSELRGLVSETWVYALVLSVISVAAGLVIGSEILVFYSVILAVMIVLFMYVAGSPAITAPIAIGLLLLLTYVRNTPNVDVWNLSLSLEASTFVGFGILIGLLVVVEGLLISKKGDQLVSPRLEETTRGLKAATNRMKRLWLVPVVTIVPVGLLPDWLPYWPTFHMGDGTYGLVLFPFVIGFALKAKHSLPVTVIPRFGQAVLLIGLLMVALSLSGYWVKGLVFAAFILGFIGRIGLSIFFGIKERAGNYAVAPKSEGVMIVGVLPESPAERMGLVVGECIRKVNGQLVTNEQELYEAIQINAAHCRLEVLDFNGEVRLRQHVIYRHDHHRLGLLII
ncbi:PDZ domain-containing protein [Paenisporosarcina cavernae]|uniref:PDZ domain-containing protein n=2 Tax=Paenisporosarcina cavernae TaxID=2320858 RepID=A0A385YWC0_9BACL|nr:PDZ domain-containing protein [Paenisporosarcina cavernae]